MARPLDGLNLNLKASNSYAVRFASCLSRGGIKRAYPLRLSPVYVQAVVGANFINSPFYYLPISYISQDFCQISLNSGDSFIREAFFFVFTEITSFFIILGGLLFVVCDIVIKICKVRAR